MESTQIDTPCPAGTALVPTWLYAVKADGLNYVAPAHGNDRDNEEDDEHDDDN